MRSTENYIRHVLVAFGLTLAILASFQLYIWREPARITADEAQEKLVAVTLGRSLYAENCAMCHGADGEGVDGPPLNDKTFLANVGDMTINSLISSGVPGTEMPAWNQLHGGPFTDQEIDRIVTFIRNWEPEAPDRREMAMMGDPANGLVIFNGTCVVCHGAEGQGTDRAPALNDPDKLGQFDDEWYQETITVGRPAQGMPTWGTVLSPVQVRDLVALLRAWERGETVLPPGPEEEIAEALHMFEHGDMHAVEHALEKAAQGATGEVLSAINDAMQAIESSDLKAAEQALRRAEDLLGLENDEHP